MLLPSELFEHFELVGIEDNADYYVFRLDEKNQPPQRHTHTYTSKGFFPRRDPGLSAERQAGLPSRTQEKVARRADRTRRQ